MVSLKKIIVAGEYIGKKVAIILKYDAQQKFEGIIVNETKNTFTLKINNNDNKNNKKKIIKKEVYVLTDFGGKKIKIDGLLLAKRNEDRVKTKI